MTPAEELRDAARILRAVAARTTPGPWKAWAFEHHWWLWSVDDPEQPWTIAEFNDPECGQSDAEWIALLNPTIAEPLAVWLESVADDAEQIGEDYRAVAVARLIREHHAGGAA